MRQRFLGWRLEVWQWACAGIVCGGLVSRPTTAAYPVTSENLPLAAAYGQGVHAYFAGDYQRSYDDLSQAIVAGTQDPRAYYFRGLAALRMGRLDEAEADFSSGADREMTQSGDWRVGRSLERVQGGDRLRLERHRTRARIVALQTDREAVRRRYSEIEDAQDEVLRRRRRPAAGPADAGNPFEADAGGVEELPAKKQPAADDGSEEKPEADEKPMADEEKPETDDEKPMADDEKPETDDEKPMADDDKPETDDEKPMADDDKPKADDDTEPAASDAPKADPDSAEKPAGDDPFGDKAPASKPEADESPEPAADN